MRDLPTTRSDKGNDLHFDGVQKLKVCHSQYDKYKSEIWDSLKALWSVWVPSQLINFAFVPRHFRVPWGA